MSEQNVDLPTQSFGPISRRTMLALATGTGLGLLSEAYSMVLTPLLASSGVAQPENKQIDATHVTSNHTESNVDIAQRYLSHAPWAAEAANMVRVGDGETFVYFQKRESEDDGGQSSGVPSSDAAENAGENGSAYSFTPFAMVWFSEGEEEPVTIVAKSAYVKFSSKLNLVSPKLGKIVTGALGGDVVVKGPNNLKLLGRNFRFEEKSRRIWCDSEVEFQYGTNSGRSQGFQVGLTPGVRGSEKQNLTIDDVKTFQLRRNVVMDLEYVPEERRKVDNKSRNPNSPNADAWDVNVQCEGSCEFTVDDGEVVFKRNVHITGVEKGKPGESNQLHCDHLMLQFAEADNPKEDAADVAGGAKNKGGSDSMLPGGSSMRFKRLQADALSPNSRVTVISTDDKLEASSRQLVYDVDEKAIWLFGKESESEVVEVKQDLNLLSTRSIRLFYDEGEVVDALCGAGWLKSFDKKRPNEVAFAARWSGSLRKFPDPETGLDIIELDQDALIQQPRERAALSADRIWLWYHELSRKERKQSERRQSLEPKQLVAQGHVNVVSADMEGETKQLEVWFDNGTEEIPRSVSRLSRMIPFPTQHLSATTRPLFSRSTNASKQLYGQVFAAVDDDLGPQERRRSDANRPGNGRDAKRDSDESESRFGGPIDVKADLIHVRAIIVDDDTSASRVAEVWTKGKVYVSQQSSDGEEPLKLNGDRLHIINRDKDDQTMTLYGQPAQIHRGQMVIQGQEVFLDRGANDSSVNGAGSLSFPVSQTMEGRKLEVPQVLRVNWQKKMSFDGKVAHFVGNVKAHLEESHLYCRHMQVELKNRISFTETDTESLRDEKTAIDLIKCTGRVSFHSLSYNEKNQLSEVRKGSFEEFEINQAKDQVKAFGAQSVPGYFISWGRGSGQGPALPGVKKAQANSPSDPDDKDWVYRRVQFAGKMVGSVNHRNAVFYDDVLVVYGPVKDPKQTIDADHLPDNGARMSCQELQVAQVRKNKRDDGHVELLARNNARVEANQYFAMASEISYDESKDQYVLRGDAQLSYQKSVGAESLPVQGQNILFIPSQKKIKLDELFNSTIIGN